LNLSQTSLTDLKNKGNLDHMENINSSKIFHTVHHVSYGSMDKNIVLDDKSIKVHVPRLLKSSLLNPLNIFLYFLFVLNITLKNQPDIIRANSCGSIDNLVGLFVSRLMNIPFVVYLGANNDLVWKNRQIFQIKRFIAHILELLSVRNANKVIVPSNYIGKYANNLGANKNKVTKIPWSVQKGFLNLEPKPKNNSGISNVLYVGRLEWEKQVDSLVKAIPIILKEFPGIKFIFIGDGSLRKYLEEEVQSYRKNIIFSGALPLSSVKLFIDQATIVWIPMSGYVILEAAALGKPIIAFDVEWHNEFIENGVNGLLVPNRSIDFLADAVIKLLKNPSLANKYGNNARRTLLEKFSPKSILKNEAKLYTELLNKKKNDN